MEEESLRPDPQVQRETILQILFDAEPDGIGSDELIKAAEAAGISKKDLNQVLKPLMECSNIYFNATKRRYFYFWSIPLVCE